MSVSFLLVSGGEDESVASDRVKVRPVLRTSLVEEEEVACLQAWNRDIIIVVVNRSGVLHFKVWPCVTMFCTWWKSTTRALVVLRTTMDHLPPILPKFFVPHLTDKPQNPIMDSLKQHPKTHLPPEVAIISAISDLPQPPRRTNNLWLEAISRNSGVRVGLIFLNLSLSDPMVNRAKHSPGINCDHLMLPFHHLPVFFLNRKV